MPPGRAPNRQIRSAVRGRVVRSVSYSGAWPTGVYWQPGEQREIPAHYPGADSDLPAGLVEEAQPKEG